MKDEDATVSNDTPCPDSESVHSKQYLESLVLVLYLLQRISPDVLDPIIRGVTAYPLHATSLPCPFLQTLRPGSASTCGDTPERKEI